MLEQWVIDQLNPLEGENLIILADPQRMLRAGAQAVDGWAKENGFTVLFCSGNLALREMYENLRYPPHPQPLSPEGRGEKARIGVAHADSPARPASRCLLARSMDGRLTGYGGRHPDPERHR